jgi:hypothetical protein
MNNFSGYNGSTVPQVQNYMAYRGGSSYGGNYNATTDWWGS